MLLAYFELFSSYLVALVRSIVYIYDSMTDESDIRSKLIVCSPKQELNRMSITWEYY